MSDSEQNSEIAALTEKLLGLSPSANRLEASRAADVAVRYPLLLAETWHATRPAVLNNGLVNLRLHPRGLCYQWADALTVKLMTLRLQTLEIHRGVAKLGTRHEHSCVVLTAHGRPFADGIALDAWRGGGEIHFAPVSQDKYAWKEAELIPGYARKLRAAAERVADDSSNGAGRTRDYFKASIAPNETAQAER